MDHSSIPSDSRPIRLKARADLVINQSFFQGEPSWVVKDPLAMKYFQLRGPEYQVLQMLDGHCSYRHIKTTLDRMFPEQRFRFDILQQLIDSFHKSGLLTSPSSGQAVPLRRRRNKELRQKAMGLLSSIIALRFPGFDPEPILSWLYPKLKWFFTAAAFWICVLIGMSAIALVLTNFDEFTRKMPDFQRFFGLNNLMFMAVVLIFTKTIHEFGHGLVCKHFGGECHEIGFMLLVMTPAMYCNTSDSWILPNKWHRMAIGAAGMYVEVVMAAIATFIWWNTQPGWLHYLCLNIMFLSSVSTVLFNANPLLRYDGYYILSDFLEIPNLAQKSRLSLINRLRVWALGMKPINPRMMPQRNQTVFAIFSVASFLYRWFVMFSIFWFLTKIFEPYGLEVIGHLLIVVSLIGMVVIPIFKVVKFFLYPGRLREVNKQRTLITTGVLSLVIAGFCFVPVPHYVWAHFVVRPMDAQHVFVTQPGTLIEIACKAGDEVKKDQILARLRNDNLTIELLQLEGEAARLEADLYAYQLNSAVLPFASRKISETQAEIEKVRRQILIKTEQIDQLVLRADRDGFVICPPNTVTSNVSHLRLAKWSGTPLEPNNLSAFLGENQNPFCYIGDPNSMKAMMIVDQSDIKFVKPGQPVQLVLNQYRDVRLRGNVSEVSGDELKHVPRELSKSNQGPVAVNTQLDGTEPPLITSFQATVPLDNIEEVDLAPGYYGRAKIKVGQASLGWRLYRYVQTVVNFR